MSTKSKKQYQYEWQKGLCCWCLQPMGDDVTWEHIKPLSLGGDKTARSNLVLAHMKCNSKRGNDTNRVPLLEPRPKNWRSKKIIKVLVRNDLQ